MSDDNTDVEVLLYPVESDSKEHTPDRATPPDRPSSSSGRHAHQRESPKYQAQWQSGAPVLDADFFAEDVTADVMADVMARGNRIVPGSACTSDVCSSASYGSRALSPPRLLQDSQEFTTRPASMTVMLPVLLDARSVTDTMVESESLVSSPSSLARSVTRASSSAAMSAAWRGDTVMAKALACVDTGSNKGTPMILSGTSTPCGALATAVVREASRPGTAARREKMPAADDSRTVASSIAKDEINRKLQQMKAGLGSEAESESLGMDFSQFEQFMPTDSVTEVVGSVSGLTSSQGAAASDAAPGKPARGKRIPLEYSQDTVQAKQAPPASGKVGDRLAMEATLPGQPLDQAVMMPRGSTADSVGAASSLWGEQIAATVWERDIVGSSELGQMLREDLQKGHTPDLQESTPLLAEKGKNMDESAVRPSDMETTRGTAFDSVDSTGMQTGGTWFNASKLDETVDTTSMSNAPSLGSDEVENQAADRLVHGLVKKPPGWTPTAQADQTQGSAEMSQTRMPSLAMPVTEDQIEAPLSSMRQQAMESVRTEASFEEQLVGQFSRDFVPSDCTGTTESYGIGPLDSVRTQATYEENILDACMAEVLPAEVLPAEVEEDMAVPKSVKKAAESAAAASVEEDIVSVKAAYSDVAASVEDDIVSVKSLQPAESVHTAASIEERIIAALSLDGEFANLSDYEPSQGIDSVRTAGSLEEQIVSSLDIQVDYDSRPTSRGYPASVGTAASLEERIADALDLGLEFPESPPPSASVRSVGTAATLEERIVATFDLLGFDEIDVGLAKRIVGTYMLKSEEDGSTTRGEIVHLDGSKFHWHDQDGHWWTLAATPDPSVFDVGSGCPYYDDGYKQMQVEFDAVGNVEYVTGPQFPIGPHWEKKAYGDHIGGNYVLDTDEETDQQLVLKYLGDNKFSWEPKRKWVHASGTPWTVTATVDPSVYTVGEDCKFFHSGYKEMRVLFDKDGDLAYLLGPNGMRWKRHMERRRTFIREPSEPEYEPAAEPGIGREPVADEPAAEPAAEPVEEETAPKARPKKKRKKTPEPSIEEEPKTEWKYKRRTWKKEEKKEEEEKPRPSFPEKAWRQDNIPRWKPKRSNLPVIVREPLDPFDLAAIHARRACKLAYHRSVAPPPVYQVYRRTALAEDIKATDHSPATVFNNPEKLEQNRQSYRKAYRSLPPGASQLKKKRAGKELSLLEPISELESSGEMSFKSTSGERKLPHIQSAPVLGAAGKASMGATPYGAKTLQDMKTSDNARTLKLLKKYNAPVGGLEMLRLLKEGRSPSILCPPI